VFTMQNATPRYEPCANHLPSLRSCAFRRRCPSAVCGFDRRRRWASLSQNGGQSGFGGTGHPIAADDFGNAYLSAENCVFRIDSSGEMTRIAGTGRIGSVCLADWPSTPKAISTSPIPGMTCFVRSPGWRDHYSTRFCDLWWEGFLSSCFAGRSSHFGRHFYQ
jgi:hypothetical protein